MGISGKGPEAALGLVQSRERPLQKGTSWTPTLAIWTGHFGLGTSQRRGVCLLPIAPSGSVFLGGLLLEQPIAVHLTMTTVILISLAVI